MEDGFIIKGSIDMASISAAVGRDRECRDCELGVEDEPEASRIVLTFSRRRMMRNVARRRIIRRRTAPLMMPPISAGVRPPPLDVVVDFVLAIAAAGIEVSFGIRPVADVATAVGACGVIAVVSVSERVCTTPASVVIVVSVNVIVYTWVE